MLQEQGTWNKEQGATRGVTGAFLVASWWEPLPRVETRGLAGAKREAAGFIPRSCTNNPPIMNKPPRGELFAASVSTCYSPLILSTTIAGQCLLGTRTGRVRHD